MIYMSITKTIRNQFGGVGIPFANERLTYTPKPFYRLTIYLSENPEKRYVAHSPTVPESKELKNATLSSASIKTNFNGTVELQIKIDLQAEYLARKEIPSDDLINKIGILEIGFTEYSASLITQRHVASNKYTRQWLFFVTATDVEFENRNSLVIFGRDFYSHLLKGFLMKTKVRKLGDKDTPSDTVYTDIMKDKFKLEDSSELMRLFYNYISTSSSLSSDDYKNSIKNGVLPKNVASQLSNYKVKIIQTDDTKTLEKVKQVALDGDLSETRTLFSTITAYAAQWRQLMFIRYSAEKSGDKTTYFVYLIFITPETINDIVFDGTNANDLTKIVKNIHLKMPFGEGRDNKVYNAVNEKEVNKVIIDSGLYGKDENNIDIKQNHIQPLDKFKVGVEYKTEPKYKDVATLDLDSEEFYARERVPIIRLFFSLPAYIQINTFDRLFFEKTDAISGDDRRKNFYIETQTITFSPDTFDVNYTALFWNGRGLDKLVSFGVSNFHDKIELMIEDALSQKGFFHDGIVSGKVVDQHQYVLSTDETRSVDDNVTPIGKKKYLFKASEPNTGFTAISPYAGTNSENNKSFGFYFPYDSERSNIRSKGIKLNKDQSDLGEGVMIGQFWNEDEFIEYLKRIKGIVEETPFIGVIDDQIEYDRVNFYHEIVKGKTNDDIINKQLVFEEQKDGGGNKGDIVLLHESGSLIVMTDNGKIIVRGKESGIFFVINENEIVMQNGDTTFTVNKDGVNIT